MEHRMVLFQCCGYSMTLLATLTKEEERERVYISLPLLSWSFLNYWFSFFFICIFVCNLLRGLCCISGAMACWHFWFSGTSEESWEGTVSISLTFTTNIISNLFNTLSHHSSFYFCYSRKNTGPETCFMVFGYQIFLWKGSRVTGSGLSFVLMKLQVWQIVGVQILRDCTLNMRTRWVISSWGLLFHFRIQALLL